MIDLRLAGEGMVDVLAGITDDQLDAATPCSEYAVRDLVAHVDEAAQGFAGMARGDGTEPAPLDVDAAGGWRRAVPEHVRALAAAWTDPAAWRGSTDVGGLELSNKMWGRIALTELVVHGWDLATATGQPFDLPEETLRACHAHIAEFVPNAPLPELWGPAAPVAADAPLLARIVAVTGRTP